MSDFVPTSVDAFSVAAATYDESFESSPVTGRVRRVVWQELLNVFPAGSRVLELNCGTGTDALFLAQHGVNVVATDGSEGMLAETRTKIMAHQFESSPILKKLSLEAFANGPPEVPTTPIFDGVLSNFGGLNCIPDLRSVFRRAAQLIRPGGYFVLCLINRHAILEIVTLLMRGRISQAFRRLPNDGCFVQVGLQSIRVWYFSPAQVTEQSGGWFDPTRAFGLSIISPYPSALRFARRHPAITRFLLAADDRVRSLPLLRSLGDHFVLVLKRKTT